MVNTHLPFVNTHLPARGYVAPMAAKKKRAKPGPKKGEPKPYARPLDKKFPERLLLAMQRRRFIRTDGKPANSELAKEVPCERATIGNYLNTERPRTTIDAPLLLDLCDALRVTPYWLLRNEGTIDDVPMDKIPLEEVRKKTKSTQRGS